MAIKTLRWSCVDAEKSAKHIAREVELMLRISHAHVVQLLDVYESQYRLTLICEMLEGPRAMSPSCR